MTRLRKHIYVATHSHRTVARPKQSTATRTTTPTATRFTDTGVYGNVAPLSRAQYPHPYQGVARTQTLAHEPRTKNIDKSIQLAFRLLCHDLSFVPSTAPYTRSEASHTPLHTEQWSVSRYRARMRSSEAGVYVCGWVRQETPAFSVSCEIRSEKFVRSARASIH